jgi:aminopeptidase YwaD
MTTSRLTAWAVLACGAALWIFVQARVHADQTPHPAELLLSRDVLRALDEELSGVAMRDHVSRLAQLHRVPASPGFHEAVVYIESRLRVAGMSDVHVETFPGDGRTWFGTMRGNRGWQVEGGELTEVAPHARRISSLNENRLLVADNSEAADVTAELIAVGAGTSARDYDGKDVRGRLVLADGSPAAVHRLAVEERGAVGIISYNSNQQTGWWRDDQDLVRWGHLDARGQRNTFAMMISLREARQFQHRLESGERVTLRARVQARNDDSLPYETLMATIPGTDASAGEVVFSCHLDHQKPGANDNASGCSANLDIARALKTLIDAKRIAPPRRTLRFVWPSEMTGTIAYLTKYPEIASRIKAAVHLDMVGGNPFITKSVLHVTRSPWSIATITDDVAETFADYVIEGAYRAAADGDVSRGIRAAGGSKDAFWADITPYESGSDHWIYQEGAFAVPTIYLRDWPDVYIHTNKDLADNIDATKIKRSAFIAAASGYYLALAPTDERSASALLDLTIAGAETRLAEDARRAAARRADASNRGSTILESATVLAIAIDREQRRLRSAERFTTLSPALQTRLEAASKALDTSWSAFGIVPAATGNQSEAGRRDARIPVRSKAIKGPLDPSSEWVIEKAGPTASRLAIAKIPNSGDVGYEIVNFIDGTRTVSDIRDAVSAEFAPIELAAVAEYLDVLAKIGAVSFR